MGSNMFTESDYYELIRLMQRTGLHFAELVTHRLPVVRGAARRSTCLPPVAPAR